MNAKARVKMVFPVRFAAAGETVQSTSRELGENGVFVRCVEPPPLGSQVALTLYLPGAAPVDLLAKVGESIVAGKDAGFWAEFDSLDGDTSSKVTKLLAVGGVTRGGRERGHSDPPAAIQNRRHLPRYLDRFRVALGEGGANHDALNVSAGGVFVRTDSPPELDAIVAVTLELPDGGPAVEVQAIVVRRSLAGEGREAGAGVQLIGADDEFRARFDAYLAKLAANGTPQSD